MSIRGRRAAVTPPPIVTDLKRRARRSARIRSLMDFTLKLFRFRVDEPRRNLRLRQGQCKPK